MTFAAAPAAARVPVEDPARTYVQARAASMSGDASRAAELLGALANASPENQTLTKQALAEAIAAGRMELALQFARRLPAAELTVDARLLLVADDLRRRNAAAALQLLSAAGQDPNLGFLAPLVRAWAYADSRDLANALRTLDSAQGPSLFTPFQDENRAFILLKFRRAAEAEPFARRALSKAGGREARLRLAFADAFLAAGDRQRALSMVEELGTETASARQRVASGKRAGVAVDSAADALSEVLLGLAADLNRLNNKSLPLGLAQVARYADPNNAAAAVLVALLLDGAGRPDQALAVLRSVPDAHVLAPQARDTAARILSDEKRHGEALTLARAAVSTRNAGASDWARLGDVYQAMKRFNEAADAYGRAVAFAAPHTSKDVMWTLHLLRASALEQGGRWPEARSALEAGLALAPEQPLLLNYLGYAKLERGEDLDAAEAMIRKASALAPDDASITDSLGWALYKRGRLAEAIETLQRAAANDPQQAEIHEHLGDALYKAGRRFEARFSWNAALITADEEIAGRVKSKLKLGLTPATAAP